MRVAVVGAGAMGCLFGGLLKKAGEDVTLIDPWEEHIKKMDTQGLLMKDDNEKEQLVKVKAYTDARKAEIADVVIFLVKGTNTENAIRQALPIINKDTTVITLQNGLGNAEKIGEVVNKNQIMFGVIEFSSILEGPGKISYQLADGNVYIQPANGQINEKVNNIINIFRKAKFNAHASMEAEKKIWEKLIINANFNALSAVTGLNIGTLMDDCRCAELLESITGEIIAVANAKNISLNLEKSLNHLKELSKKVREHYPSMAQDMAKKRETEIEFINGAVVREGKKLNIPVPVNETLYNLVKILQNNYNAKRL